MKADNPVRSKSFSFAVDIVRTCQILIGRKEYVLGRQLLASGTSIGANIEEAQAGQSRRDFIAKLSISHKEALETIFWLKLLRETGVLEDPTAEGLLRQAQELWRMLSSILLTAKRSEWNRYRCVRDRSGNTAAASEARREEL